MLCIYSESADIEQTESSRFWKNVDLYILLDIYFYAFQLSAEGNKEKNVS